MLMDTLRMIFFLRYSLCALIATTVNVGIQFVSLSVYHGASSLYVAMLLGTIAGLGMKYILDKIFIFNYQAKNFSEDGKKFIIYSLLGLVTTILFWSVEIAFDTVFESPVAKYVGAVLGLCVGYVIKYFLDRRYVFTSKEVVT